MVQGGNIRVSLDVDGNRISYWWSIIKGLLFLRRMPDRTYKTRKGYHIIYEGLPITEEQSTRYRKLCGDDGRRIHLDSTSNKRLKQVLFSTKEVRFYEPAKDYTEEKKLIRTEVFERRRLR